MFMIIIFIVLALYLAANYFVALQFATMFPSFALLSYSIVALLTLTTLATMLVRTKSVGAFIGKLGNYWMGLGLLAFVIFAISKLLPFPSFYIALSLTLLLFGYGVWHAKQIKLTNYEVTLSAPTAIKHAVLISDVHLGYIVDDKHFAKIVAHVNALEPDVVLIAGDLFDSNFAAIKQPDKIAALLNTITAPSFLIWGNHDAGDTFDAMRAFIATTKVTLLEDEVTIINGLQLVGRKDIHPIGQQGLPRAPMPALQAMPTIVLDHQPSTIDDYHDVDLIVSGHTHKGQLFPFGLITKKLFTVDYGYKRLPSGVQVVVSSGVGFWGPPMRIGTKSEIVSLKLQ